MADSFIYYDESEDELAGAGAAAFLALIGFDADLLTFSLPASTTISAFGASLVDDAAATNGRDTLELGSGNSPVFVTVKLSGLTDDYIPYHVDDSTGLANGPTKTNVDSAVSLKHAAVTVSAPLSVTGQALSLINDAAATITEIDTGALANSDTKVPTSKAVTTALASAGGGYELLTTGVADPPTLLSHGGDVLSARL
jgi:hypothetical protein